MVEVQKEIEDLLQQGLINTSGSPCLAPIVCARRKNGQLRLAMDYKALNAQTISNLAHPIPLIKDWWIDWAMHVSSLPYILNRDIIRCRLETKLGN